MLNIQHSLFTLCPNLVNLIDPENKPSSVGILAFRQSLINAEIGANLGVFLFRDAPILLSFVIIMLRRQWLAKDEIDIIDLLNASDAFRKFCGHIE